MNISRILRARTHLSTNIRPRALPSLLLTNRPPPKICARSPMQWSRRQKPSVLVQFRAPASYTALFLVGLSMLVATPLSLDSLTDESSLKWRNNLQVNPTENTMIASEDQMLAISEAEARERHHISSDAPTGLIGAIKFYEQLVELWVVETISTTLRFLYLVAIFAPVILSTPAIWLGAIEGQNGTDRSGTLWWYRLLLSSMERAGPTFIKLGQWAATRTDIFPTELCRMMSSLHSNVSAHSITKTKKIIEKAFDGLPFDSIFSEFVEEPLGVGAIAQVYKAKLRRDLLPPAVLSSGESQPLISAANLREKVGAMVKSSPSIVPSTWVAIKVLHPHAQNMVERDLRIMGVIASAIDWIPTLEWLSLPDEVEKFGEMMKMQLDLRIEANNLVNFRNNFNDRATVTFPIPYTEYTTRQVLVEEFAHGIPLQAFLESGGGVFQNDIADMGLDAFLHMLIIDNFTHADLHPGNIMVRFCKPVQPSVMSQLRIPFFTPPQPPPPVFNDSAEILHITEEALSRLRPYRDKPHEWVTELAKLDAEGYRPQLVLIDTGLVTELSPSNRRNFLDLFVSIAEFDGYRAGKLMIERSRQPNDVLEQDVFCLRMQHIVLGVKSKTFALGNIKIADILGQVLDMVRRHHVRLEGDFVNVVISMLLLEGIGRRLDPDIDLLKSSLPILRQIGVQSGPQILKTSESGMLKVWVGLELREFLTASALDVENCVKYDLLSPNI